MARGGPGSRWRPAWQAASLAALLIYFALALPNLTLPGLHPDEAQEAGLQAQQILAGRPVTAFRGASIQVLGLGWPLMVQDYIGSLNVLLALPFFALLGSSVMALRLMSVAVGLATLALAQAAGAAVFGRRVGAIAGLLLAVQPSFLFWSRQGVFVTSVTAALALAWLLSMAIWWQRGGAWRLALGGVLAGLGVYAKLLFVWVLGGALAAGAVVLFLLRATRTPGRWPRAPRLLRAVPVFALALLAGAAPLLLYNLRTSGTLASVGSNLTTSFYGVNNLDLGANLATRWDTLRAVLAGRDHLWYLGGSFGNPWTEWLVASASLAVLLHAAARRPGWAASLGLLLLTLAAFAQTIFTVSGLFPTHFAVLLPLFPLLAAVGLDRAGALATGWLASLPRLGEHLRRGLTACAVAVVALAMARDVWVAASYHRALARTGGLNAHSDAIYSLAAHLDAEGSGCMVVALDWGIAPQVRFLTGGRVAPVELFGYSWEPDEAFAGELRAALARPNTVFVLHWPQEAIFPRGEAFEAELQRQGLADAARRTFARRDGAPVFEVVVPPGVNCGLQVGG
jgi:hypothetical protein